MRTLALILLILPPLPATAKGPSLLSGPSSLVYPDFWHTPMGVHKGTPKLLSLFLGERSRFNDPQGLACTRMLEHGDENPQLTVFGVNSGRSEIIYNPDMLSLDVFGHEGQGPGEFLHPMGVACRPDGRVAVADTGNHRVVFLRFAGRRLLWEAVLGTRGRGNGQFESPSWLAYDSQGRLYVSDTGNNRVQVFSDGGNFLFSFGGDPGANNSLLEPQAIAVADPMEKHAHSPKGMVYVVDQYHGRIQKFGLDGRFLGAVTAPDFERFLVYFDGIALDYYHNLWVVDRGAHQIHKFDEFLQYIDSWGSRGHADFQLDSPRGLAIYRHYGQVFVSERESAQYLWIGADIKDIKVSRGVNEQGKGMMRADWKLTEHAKVECWIEDLEQLRLTTLLLPKKMLQGSHTTFWDGFLPNGERIPNGMYWLVYQAEANYSSATYFKKEARKKFWVK